MKITDLETWRLRDFDVKDQLRQYVYSRSLAAFAAGDRDRDAIVTQEQLETRRKTMRAKLLEQLGGLPSSDAALEPCVTETVAFAEYRVEKIVFQARPQTYVTANLYVPDDVRSPRGAVVFACGHDMLAKHSIEYQNACQYLVGAGLIVMAIDPIGQGERLSYYDPETKQTTVGWGTGEHEHAGEQCWPLGDGIARYFLHDMMRAIDYLVTRPEVDSGKIGITGNSGGGMQTCMAMLVDDLIAAAAPGTFLSSREAIMLSGKPQDAEQIWPGMTAIGFDHEDSLLAMAPRPVLVLASTDDFFPIEGTRRTVERARRFWAMCGHADGLELFEDEAVHKYTEHHAQAAAMFFAKHLNGEARSVRHVRPALAEPSLLWCTASGQVKSDYADTRTIWEENRDRAAELAVMRSRLSEQERELQARSWLKQKVFDGRYAVSLNDNVMGGRRTVPLNPRYLALPLADEQLRVRSVFWRSQELLFSHALVFRNVQQGDASLPVTIAVWNGGTSRLQPHMPWIREQCAGGRIVMVLDVAGAGALAPNPVNTFPVDAPFGTIHKLAMDLFWLDDSLAALRTFDVLRALDMAECLRGCVHADDDIHVYTHGTFSVYAQLAAGLDRRVAKLEVVGGCHSVSEWVQERHYDIQDRVATIMPGMLRYLDLPDLHDWRDSELD
ncbi:alpha/beta hydrolase family protein [Paenibacillus sp. 2RAB27]|uniref:alpha/beta hydrolase family protein n=1 Tax=Paenibacillus sp. 2RAB27 TaxID=3232991 RepID=UPI003F9AB189